jgi:replicative DNA helicase
MTQKNIFSIEPEVAVLSILLRFPDTSYSTEGLRFFMFSSLPHQIIYQEIENLLEKQFLPDAHLIVNSLESSKNLSKVGGKDYIEQLIKEDFQKENLKEYTSFIIASYKARSLLSTISGVKSEELNIDNVDFWIDKVKKSLDNLMESSGGTLTVHIGDGIKAAFDAIVARAEHPGIRGSSWGISDIDLATGGKSSGDLWIISGRPSSGKTAVICNSILVDGKNGVPCLLFSKEMNYQILLERLVAIETGIPIQSIRLGFINQEQLKVIADALAEIKKYPIYIDTSFTSDLYYLESTIVRFKSLYNIKNVYIDYLQLLSERDENQTQELGRISRLLKLLANQHELCIMAVSQLNRAVEQRDNKRPLMSDLRQSGSLEEDADFVVGLYREDYYNKETTNKGLMEFSILKSRNGPVGTITLKFVADSNKVSKAK